MRIEVDAISYAYDKNKIIDNWSAQIFSGEVTCLTGENGSGKSTFIEILTKVRTSYTGNIFIDGMELKKIHRKEFLDKVGIMLQESWVYFDSVINNIKSSSTDDSSKIIKWIDYFELSDVFPFSLTDRIIGIDVDLSGGQKQLLGILRAVYSMTDQKELLIFDEPTNNLDERNTMKFCKMIENLAIDKTILVITHDVTLLDKYTTLKLGRVSHGNSTKKYN